MTTATLYPFDFESIQKGDVITASEIEEKSGTAKGTPAYAWAALGYQQLIEDATAELERPVVTRQVGYDIRIMTDSEATKRMEQRALAHERGMARSLRGLAKVDAANLSADETIDHQDRIIYISRMVQGSKRGRLEGLKMIAHERTLPGALEPPKEDKEKDDEKDEQHHM